MLILGGFGTAGFGNMQTTLMLTEAPIEVRSRLMGIVTVVHRHRPARRAGRRRAGRASWARAARSWSMATLGLAATLALVLALRRR